MPSREEKRGHGDRDDGLRKATSLIQIGVLMILSQDIGKITIQILILGGAASILYLWGYWHTFGIIIFEYANFKDIITATGILLGLTLFPGFVGAFISTFILWPLKLEPGAGAKSREGQVLLRWKYIILVIYLLILLATWFYMPFPQKLYFFPGWFSIGFSIIAQNFGFLSEVEDYRIQGLLTFIVLYVASAAYPAGEYRAKTILDDHPKTFYEIGSKRKYLGYANGYFFLLSPDNSKVTINRAKSIDSFVLTRVEKKEVEPKK